MLLGALAAAFMLAASVALVGMRDEARASSTAGCTRARIGPSIECVARNKRCRPRYESDYRHYGFTCKRAHDGLYRLKERVFIGPPRPVQPTTPYGSGG